MQPFDTALTWLKSSWQTLLAWLLAVLSACNPGPTVTTMVRDNANGVDRLYSQSRAQGGQGRFECLASQTGQCHYLVVDRDCQPGACATARPQVFSVAVGATLERADLPQHPRICVDAKAPPRDCAQP
ncbi:MAG TPA: hypothetical protein VM469_15860 [Pseudoxanthomonas sp.]|jgi:hypothetical protein|nr:hypothetical protein [Pseudoxanthomonas sp.]